MLDYCLYYDTQHWLPISEEEDFYFSEERKDFSSSLLFKTYIMISEILVRIGPIIILAVLNTLIIYKFLRIAKRRHQLKRYSLQLSTGPPSTFSESGQIVSKTASFQEEVTFFFFNHFIRSWEPHIRFEKLKKMSSSFRGGASFHLTLFIHFCSLMIEISKLCIRNPKKNLIL